MITLLSPAKINIFLRVVGKLPDGRPETASLCQIIDLGDEMRFSLSDKDAIHCSDPSIPHSYTMIIRQAVEIFRLKTGKRFSVEVHLDKRIPRNSGLGGKSSNAATTLWALNKLQGDTVPVKELREWAKELTQEAPLFFNHGTTLHCGNEPKETHFAKVSSQPLWIASPAQKFPVNALFNRLRIDELPFRELSDLIQNAEQGAPSYFNDLEEPAIAIFPRLALFKEKLLEAGASQVIMSGSGPSLTCYGLANPPQLDGVSFFRAHPITRKTDTWY